MKILVYKSKQFMWTKKPKESPRKVVLVVMLVNEKDHNFVVFGLHLSPIYVQR